MTTPAELLRAAEGLVGDSSRAKGAWARAAALLTRQAAEASLMDLWSRRSPGLATCPARIQLICLPAAGLDTDVARQVRHAWSLLSAACHHHPYDVAPSSHELRQWMRVAARLSTVIGSMM
jgi:hypothetical protein